MPRRKFVTQAEYARHCGLHPSTIRTQIKNGIIPTHKGKIDVAEADCARAERVQIDGRRRGKRAQTDMAIAAAEQTNDPDPTEQANGLNITKIKTAKATVDLRIASLDLKRKEGKLVDRDAARRAFFHEFRAVRDSLLNWPSRVAAVIAGEVGCNPKQMQDILERYIREHLEELSSRDIGAVLTDALSGEPVDATRSDQRLDADGAASA